MTYRIRSPHDAVHWMMQQHESGASHWRGMCQSSARSAYGVPAWASSAISAWNKIPHGKKHAGGKPEDAPEGAVLYYSGGRYGHAAIAGKRRNVAWSTDYEASGKIGRAPRDFKRWGLRYLGWSKWTPFGEME